MHVTGRAGDDDGLTSQTCGKAVAQSAQSRAATKETNAATAQPMAVAFNRKTVIKGPVTEDDIKRHRRQLGKQSFGRIFAAMDAQIAIQAQGRFQQSMRDQFGQRIDDADVQRCHAIGAASGQAIDEIVTNGENFIAVAQDESSGIGELQTPTDAGEQGFAELPFQIMQLAADGRLC